jgi:signal transduction histidine kinase
MLLPMRGRDRVLGVICYVRTVTNKPFEGHRVGLARELSSRVALSLDNAELLKRARDATRIRDEVLRVVAHDLRSPLNTISLTTDFLQEKLRGPEPERWAGKLDIIMRSVGHADRLIQDLLDVARMEAGTLMVEVLPTHVHGLISEVLEMHQALAEDRGIRLVAEIPPNAGLVKADPGRIVQVFSNLIGNAIKFSPRGTAINLRAKQRKGTLMFSIQDRGPGIPQQEQSHLFDPFWQARKGSGGVGLGLPIAKAIIGAHGGRIWCESALGQGSTFYFTLPVAQERRQADRASGERSAAD